LQHEFIVITMQHRHDAQAGFHSVALETQRQDVEGFLLRIPWGF
jgi:hypothetical protein